MKKRWLGTIAVLAAAALAVGAVPAFTADNGTLTLTIAAQGAPAACVLVAPDATTDFGTLPFSNPTNPNPSASRVTLNTTNCGAEVQNLGVTGTDANGPSGSWTLTDPGSGNQPCGLLPDLDRFFLFGQVAGSVNAAVTTSPSLFRDSSGQPMRFQPNQLLGGALDLMMPCQGSSGTGETKTFTVTYVAVVA